MNPDSPIDTLSRLDARQKEALNKLRVKTIRDLLYHFPSRYADLGEITTIDKLVVGEKATIYGQISKLKIGKAFRKKITMADGEISDQTGKIKAVWFNQPYIAKLIQNGASVKLSGKVTERKGSLYLANPEIETTNELPIDIGDSLFGKKKTNMPFIPIYPESRGITSRWFYYSLQKVLQSEVLDKIIDPIPEEILSKYHLPNLKTALIWIHSPKKAKHSEMARKRFAFEEIFFIQLSRQEEKINYAKHKSFIIDKDKKEVSEFTKRFPFGTTPAQIRSIETILADFRSGSPMSRLLEGDVGSGKTAVAATTAYAVVTTRPNSQNFGTLQTAYMAPTEILASQHFESFIKYFRHMPIQIGLITGSGCKKFPSKVSPDGWTDISRTQLLKWVKNGEIAILLGTHALIQKSVEFKNLAYIIIDEQHRFGIEQRRALARGKTRNERRMNAENKPVESIDSLLYRDLTYRIREAIFKVKKGLGLGHKEIVYQKALEEAFTSAKLIFNREKQIPIFYQKKRVGVYQPDFVIDNKVIVELKALPFLGTEPKKQLWNYLKGSPYRLGLLVNFGHSELDIGRVVYDQARGISSASSLQDSASIPHLLSMTATPIPRTLALTIYGDLDLSLLDEMPPGRKPVITEIIPPNKRDKAYEKIREELVAGRQAYVICPRIEETPNDAEQTQTNAEKILPLSASGPQDSASTSAYEVKSVKTESVRLQKEIFPEYKIGALYSKMSPAEKERVMDEFSRGEIDILVATSVVEVGVNVPNATVIIIEGAERFGLSQLHQLRGRVIRSTRQPYCFVFSETKTEKSLSRLKALVTAKNGFELSELDLALRGPGELSGTKQWGISDLGMEAIKNIKMVEAAREEARSLLKNDSELTEYPILKKELLSRGKDIHFE